MAIYGTTLDVTAVTAFPTLPNITIPFQPRSIAIVNENLATAIEVSFDGVNVHARLTPGLPSAGMVFGQKSEKVWLRAAVGGGTSVVARLTAEQG